MLVGKLQQVGNPELLGIEPGLNSIRRLIRPVVQLHGGTERCLSLPGTCQSAVLNLQLGWILLARLDLRLTTHCLAPADLWHSVGR